MVHLPTPQPPAVFRTGQNKGRPLGVATLWRVRTGFYKEKPDSLLRRVQPAGMTASSAEGSSQRCQLEEIKPTKVLTG